MSYAASVLQPGETILRMGRLHWTIYLRSLAYLVLAGVVWTAVEAYFPEQQMIGLIAAALLLLLFCASFLHAWFVRWITEFAVTNRRVIYKVGFINRRTVEMNMDKVQSVEVEQSIPGRLMGYGTINVMGTGSDEGSVIRMKSISNPIALRSAITSR